jgi:hypothetical protein
MQSEREYTSTQGGESPLFSVQIEKKRERTFAVIRMNEIRFSPTQTKPWLQKNGDFFPRANGSPRIPYWLYESVLSLIPLVNGYHRISFNTCNHHILRMFVHELWEFYRGISTQRGSVGGVPPLSIHTNMHSAGTDHFLPISACPDELRNTWARTKIYYTDSESPAVVLALPFRLTDDQMDAFRALKHEAYEEYASYNRHKTIPGGYYSLTETESDYVSRNVFKFNSVGKLYAAYACACMYNHTFALVCDIDYLSRDERMLLNCMASSGAIRSLVFPDFNATGGAVDWIPFVTSPRLKSLGVCFGRFLSTHNGGHNPMESLVETAASDPNCRLKELAIDEESPHPVLLPCIALHAKTLFKKLTVFYYGKEHGESSFPGGMLAYLTHAIDKAAVHAIQDGKKHFHLFLGVLDPFEPKIAKAREFFSNEMAKFKKRTGGRPLSDKEETTEIQIATERMREYLGNTYASIKDKNGIVHTLGAGNVVEAGRTRSIVNARDVERFKGTNGFIYYAFFRVVRNDWMTRRRSSGVAELFLREMANGVSNTYFSNADDWFGNDPSLKGGDTFPFDEEMYFADACRDLVLINCIQLYGSPALRGAIRDTNTREKMLEEVKQAIEGRNFSIAQTHYTFDSYTHRM